MDRLSSGACLCSVLLVISCLATGLYLFLTTSGSRKKVERSRYHLSCSQ